MQGESSTISEFINASGRQSEAVNVSSSNWTGTVGAWTPTMILVGGAGNITGQLQSDTSDLVYVVPAGLLTLRFKIIRHSGTTATNLVVIRG